MKKLFRIGQAALLAALLLASLAYAHDLVFPKSYQFHTEPGIIAVNLTKHNTLEVYFDGRQIGIRQDFCQLDD